MEASIAVMGAIVIGMFWDSVSSSPSSVNCSKEDQALIKFSIENVGLPLQEQLLHSFGNLQAGCLTRCRPSTKAKAVVMESCTEPLR